MAALNAIGWAFILFVASYLFNAPTIVWVLIWVVIVVIVSVSEAYESEEKVRKRSLKRCRACAEEIQIAATKCKHCGEIQ